MTELKNCPFCGCDVELQPIEYPGGAKDWVISGWHDSDCIFELTTFSPLQSAYKHALVSAWNRRASND